jgi:hypothetical protein
MSVVEPMKRHLRALVCCCAGTVLVSCPEPAPPPPPVPPQAFITVNSGDAVDVSVKGTVSTSGCKKVTQMRILANDIFLADANYSTNPTSFELPRGLFNPLYKQLGLALNVNLSSEVQCDDGRKAVSQPVNVRFMPVEQVISAPTGLAAPETFIAEGGVGGVPTTFLGCVGSKIGGAIQRTSATATELKTEDTFPFRCTNDSVISAKNAATGYRWLMRRGGEGGMPEGGLVAFNQDLVAKGQALGNVREFGVAANGDAVAVVDTNTVPKLWRVKANPANANDQLAWDPVDLPLGQPNASPIIDVAADTIYLSLFRFNIGTRDGEVVVYKYRFSTGVLLNDPGTLIVRQKYPPNEEPIMPMGFFSNNGSQYYLALPALDTTTGKQNTFVFACTTSTDGCQGAARKWTSPLFPGVLTTLTPFSGGTYVAASGPKGTYFLADKDGKVVSLAGQPLAPDDDRFVYAVEAGKGTDFYVLTGPKTGKVSEVIATDTPEKGVLWRLQVGSGVDWASSNWLAIDDGGTLWMRVQTQLVKMLKPAEYRAVR